MTAEQRTSLSIGMIHFKTGDTDGVSLEMDKWRDVLRSEGHAVHYCCGQRPLHDDGQCTILPSLSYFREEIRALDKGTFDSLEAFGSESAYEEALTLEVRDLSRELLAWIDSVSLDVLIVENIWSVGLHPAAAIALDHVVQARKLPVLAHHHDFYWERVNPIRLTCNQAMQVADCYMPPHTQGYSHVVINSKAQKALWERKGISATIIPNVFDFSEGPWERDAYNRDFRETFGIKDDDVFLLQATRVVRRKAIELAIDFAWMLAQSLERYRGKTLYNGKCYSEKSRVVLVLAGSIEHDGGAYLTQLQEKADRLHVPMVWIGAQIGHTRTIDEKNGKKIYSLWDAYVHADVVTYPSYWEGWGNQLLEAVRAKLPIILFPYEIYSNDIKKAGFSMIELGKRESLYWDEQGFAQLPPAQIKQAARAACAVLFDRQVRSNMVESNFKIGRNAFSLDTLRTLLTPYLTTWSNTLW
ncbi:MAG: glycosyltransferase [Sphaerochaetaceae bacterium]